MLLPLVLEGLTDQNVTVALGKKANGIALNITVNFSPKRE